MSNAPATAAAITNHDEFVAFWTAPQNVSEFALTVIPASIVAESRDGDWLASEILASDVKNVARLEALTDAALEAERAANEAAHRRAIADEDPWEYDVNDYESYYHQQWIIEELQAYRKVRATYTGLAPLTHSPFAALAV